MKRIPAWFPGLSVMVNDAILSSEPILTARSTLDNNPRYVSHAPHVEIIFDRSDRVGDGENVGEVVGVYARLTAPGARCYGLILPLPIIQVTRALALLCATERNGCLQQRSRS